MGRPPNAAQRRFGYVIRFAFVVRLLLLLGALVVVMKILGVW